MLRLVAYAPDGVRRFAIHRSELLIGSQPGCDVYLPYSGVAQAHARLRYDGSELRIEDLGSRRGLTVAGRRVRDAPLAVLDEVRLGSVTLLVEDVMAEAHRPAAAPVHEPETREPRIAPEVMLEHLNGISNWVLADVESRIPLESLVGGLLKEFGGGALFLLNGELSGEPGTKFVSATEAGWLAAGDEILTQVRRHHGGEARREESCFEGELAGSPSWIGYHAFEAVERPYLLILALPGFKAASWTPASSLRVLGDLLVLGLVHHVGWYEPILPGRLADKELVLAPGLVAGESPAMKALVEQMRLAVDPEIHVLVRGEAGVGKELVARSLHLSSPRRQGPFVVATCLGATPAMLEADLFGAEVPGKESVVRREGKLLLAHGGTLFLHHVEGLTLDLQARLVRFLRSGEVEPAGSRTAATVDVRLIASATGPLDPYVARDAFRVDLAYRLSQLALDVPPVRMRREDLPLLIQSAINRCCHETGKRMQGITVKAMSALLAYDYPGNLTELEAIARQLVYLCPAGQPIDVNLLPEKVRLSTVQAASRVDSGSDLDLERLVAATERSAIREALRRAHGNKSQAARLLGLSRNGLAMKMERHGLRG
jgi:transcriptional regulator with AAA-type ATPase domain/pSer/pThr/pTyr-binding forkhead associated (FHA) protein